MRNHVLAALSLFLSAAGVAAAGNGDGLRDFDFVKDVNPYLELSNPAAMSGWNGRIAAVSAGFEKADGGLVSLTQSSDSYLVEAGTESYYRMSDKIAFHGKLGWSYTEGKNMGGAILMNPDYNPVNFYESDPTTVGKKQQEWYTLTGAMAYMFNDVWSAGVSFDYDCSDLTKIKDPRFANTWIDMNVQLGAGFKPSDNLFLGLSAIYRNTLEQVLGGIKGMQDKHYFIQVDRGGYYGTVSELIGAQNFLSPESKRPMNNTFYGGALQAIFGGRFANEVTFLMRDGHFGYKNSSSSPVFFEFSGIQARYNGSALFHSKNSIHKVSLDAGFESLGNDENSYKYVTPQGEATRVEYTGVNHVLDRIVIDGNLGYRWYTGIVGEKPTTTVGADIAFYSKSQTTEIYPFYREHSFTRIDADIFASHDFKVGKSYLIPEVHVLAHTGFGVDKEDGAYANSSGSKLKSFDVWLGKQFEYDTATRAGAELGITWAKKIRKVSLYAKASDRFMYMLAEPVSLEGRMRNVAMVTVGCSF